MLVLSRKVGERIQIGDDVQLVVLRSTGGRVRLGIDAPREVSIQRHEVLARQVRRSTDEIQGEDNSVTAA